MQFNKGCEWVRIVAHIYAGSEGGQALEQAA